MTTLLKDLTYYRTGGTVDELVAPNSIDELADSLKRISSASTPYFILGGGSNSLVMDEHWPGAVISLTNLNSIVVDGQEVNVEAGVDNTLMAETCLEMSLGGASWMYKLPGQVGGAIRMNARCYGGEISEIVKTVTTVSTSGEIKSYSANEVFLGYKSTTFMETNEIIASADFTLLEDDKVAIMEHMEYCRQDREDKNQFLFPSCGCVFKNDYDAGVPSGLLLDRSNVREFSSETVEISPSHANFVFNKGASANEILETTLNMRDRVFESFGVWLEYEMQVLGKIPEKLKTRLSEKRESSLKRTLLDPLRKQFAGDN